MCGIVGFIDFRLNTSEETLKKMTQTLFHRGPDDHGIWVANLTQSQVGLGHRRLSIIDLRPESAQPMHYKSLTITYNGEIYNYLEIKEQLIQKGHVFQTASDTEVILHAFYEWGPTCVEKMIGMFAFAIIDQDKESAYIFRDRTGTKPVYLYHTKQLIIFASELKAFFEHPHFEPAINRDAVAQYFDFGYVSSGSAIFNDTIKLKSGSYWKVNLSSGEATTYRYWSIYNLYRNPSVPSDYKTERDKLGELLRSACRYRMVADVPVGVFLSGGYDSTSVLASLQADSDDPVKAFTIGFEHGNNELPQAREIAKFLGAEHHTYVCTETDARRIIPDLPKIFDEPFADSSAIPTILVSEFAAGHVKVALSADGGDELFLGYTSYAKLGSRIARLKHLPKKSRRHIGEVLNGVAAMLPSILIQKKHMLTGVAKALDARDDKMALQLHVVSKQLPDVYRNALFHGFRSAEQMDQILEPDWGSDLAIAAAWDYENYLADDILVKVDRATMSASLEGREPLLDHRLAEFALQLPEKYKKDADNQKVILKDYVHQHVPQSIMQGPKRGFSVPVLQWLRNDLSYLLDEYLSVEAIRQSGIFRTDKVVEIVDAFRNHRLHYTPLIWKLLMFQMWYRYWMSER